MGKAKVVIDTNVFVSALLKPQSKERYIYKLALNRQIQLFVSQPMLAELARVVDYPKFDINPLDKETFLKNVCRVASFIEPKRQITIIKADPPDNRFLECAVEVRADYIITGDTHLESLKKYSETKIVSPCEFLKIWEAKQNNSIQHH